MPKSGIGVSLYRSWSRFWQRLLSSEVSVPVTIFLVLVTAGYGATYLVWSVWSERFCAFHAIHPFRGLAWAVKCISTFSRAEALSVVVRFVGLVTDRASSVGSL